MTNLSIHPGLVPITLGITGHRDIPDSDISLIESAINSCLETVDKDYPNSPKVLISGLAEGVDQIAALCAVNKGWKLHALLALPKEEFLTTFDQTNKKTSIANLEFLLGKSSWITVASDSNTPAPECFINVAHLIAQKAQWLIACWDGIEALKADGGTSYTVKVFRDGRPSSLPNTPDNGPVKWIRTRRLNDQVLNEVGHIVDIAPTTATILNNNLENINDHKYLKIWEDILKKIDFYNKEAQLLISNYPDRLNKKRIDYLQIKDSLSETAEKASWLFVLADEISLIAGKKRSTRLITLILVSVIALICHALYAESPIKDWTWQVISLSLAFGAALTVIDPPEILHRLFPLLKYLNIRIIESSYLDCRALAESSRIQFFWSIANLNLCVSDYFLRDQRNETEWIRQSIRTTIQHEREDNSELNRQRAEYILQAWIRDQKNFFIYSKKSMKYHAAREKKLTLIAKSLLISAIALALTSLLLQWLDVELFDTEWLDFFYTCALTISGATKIYQETQGHLEHSRSYEKMGLMMLIAEGKMTEYWNDPEVIKSIIKEVGLSALDENAGWLELHRERPANPIFGA